MPRVLDLQPIVVDRRQLVAADSGEQFRQHGYEMLARVGQMSEQIVDAVQRETPAEGLSLDEAVIGGLLVRLSKQTRGIFDATQADESEAHGPLSRCAAETAITLSYLARHGDDPMFRRFRADSFAYWRAQLDGMRAGADREDDDMRLVREKVEAVIEHEIQAASVKWEDVPRRSNSWGPSMRDRCEAIEEAWVYDTLFASHSSYVHPTWHELRTFHLSTSGGRLELDVTYGTMAPIAAYVVARVIAGGCGDAVRFLPCDLDPDDAAKRVDGTIEASQVLSFEYADFLARGGEDENLERHPGAGGPFVGPT